MKRSYQANRLDQARNRAERIKDRLTIPRLAEIRQATIVATGSSGAHESDCPACGAPQESGAAAAISSSGRTFRCGACGASGDVITFEMAATGADFQTACARLEELLETPADPDTGELFAAGGAS